MDNTSNNNLARRISMPKDTAPATSGGVSGGSLKQTRGGPGGAQKPLGPSPTPCHTSVPKQPPPQIVLSGKLGQLALSGKPPPSPVSPLAPVVAGATLGAQTHPAGKHFTNFALFAKRQGFASRREISRSHEVRCSFFTSPHI